MTTPDHDTSSDMRVALAGDWHGRTTWAAGRLLSLAATHPDIDTLLHLGDFGIWPGPTGAAYLNALEKVCARTGIRILITPGNHEDWNRLEGGWHQQAIDRGAQDPASLEGREPLTLTDHISVLPRGYRFALGGRRTFVSLGGAPSVDFDMPHRVEGQSWWREEAITPADVAYTVAGGHAEIFLAHDSPEQPYMTPKVMRICHGEPDPDEITFSWSTNALAYAAIGRDRMTEAFLAVRPKLFVHGHYHVTDQATVTLPDGHPCLIHALGADGQRGNVAILDLDTLTITTPT